jgi:hypothetical protein
MLIKNSKVLIINGNWLNPVETPVPPGPQPTGEWKNITGTTTNNSELHYETYHSTWGNSIPLNDIWLKNVTYQGWRGLSHFSQMSEYYERCGTSTMNLTGETEYKDYFLLDITSLYYLECASSYDYYYPSLGVVRLLDISIEYKTSSSTGISPGGNTQSNDVLIRISESNGNAFQVKIGDTLGHANSCSNIKLLFDLNNHITYALCRPVPTTQTYDPTDFTNLKWHILKENNGYDSSLLTRSNIDYRESIGKFDRTVEAGNYHWIVSGLAMDSNIPQWSYKGTLNLPIDNESYHDYT